jgi:hypothetical protein
MPNPTTTREAEKLVWLAKNASSQFVARNAKDTLLATADKNGLFKVYDASQDAFCLFIVEKTRRGDLTGRVASHPLDFSEDGDKEEMRAKFAPYLSDADLQEYIRYFL